MASSVEEFNYFSLLGLSPTSNSADLKQAFRREAKRWHPDLNKDDQNAELRFQWINESYRVLKDPQKRLQWEISGKPSFVIPNTSSSRKENFSLNDIERSTNGDTSFSSGEKFVLFIMVSISLIVLNTFVL
tara:strand:- start:574 stop:966 length:393 start_codon:yes stop_codon:yes gene_type:complete